MRLQTRLALLFGGVVTLAAALTGVLCYAAIADRLQATVDESLTAEASPLADELARGRLPREVVDGSDGPGGRGHEAPGGLVLPTQIVLAAGSVVTSPSTDVVLPVDARDLTIARSRSAASRFRDVTIGSVPYRMVTQTSGGANGAVQVGRDVAENDAVMAALAWLLTAIGLTVGVLAALAGWLVARRAAARLVTLTDAAEHVSATGTLDVRVPTEGADEIARLGTAFDTMLLRLAESREEQQRLVQDAGHELRTPLTSLRTNVHLLGQFEALSPEQRSRVIADLDGETRELTHLVNEVVHLVRASPTDPARERILLVGPTQSAVERARRRTRRDVRLLADDSMVLAQPALVDRAIGNLIENACKFSPPETPVEVTVRNGVVTVRDHGSGIDPADAPHVFERFYRSATARSLPGSGLGLAIVRDIVTAHGGSVFAQSCADGGAATGFQLPVTQEGPDQQARPAPTDA